MTTLTVSMLAVASKGIAKKGFRMQGAHPVSILLHPGRSIGSIKCQLFALIADNLMNIISDDGNILAQLLHFGILDFVVKQRPCWLCPSFFESCLVHPRRPLGTRKNAGISGKLVGRSHVIFLE